MPGFLDPFGGTAIQPSKVGYSAVSLAGSIVTYWPPYVQNTQVLADVMDVTPAAGSYSIAMPDATLGSAGTSVIFINRGLYAFTVNRYDGSTILTVTPGQVVFVYLQLTSTAAGTWNYVFMGSGTSTLDLANSAGNGLLVAAAKLAVSPIASEVSASFTISANDRSKFFAWTGGTGTMTLPTSASVGQFFFEVRNQGSGALTLSCSGGETIDGSATVILQVNESCFVNVNSSTGKWYTVGRGRNTLFNFTQLQKSVVGGTTTLTLTEASNVVQTYTGVLASNEIVVLPAVVQVYYVSNQTSGAFNFTFKNAGAGTTVAVPTGQNAVLFSDGTNVINASTTLAGLSSLILAAGSVSAPSLGVGASNTGIYSANTNEISFTSNGAKIGYIDSTGLVVVSTGGQLGLVVPAGNASVNVSRVAGSFGTVNYLTGVNQRWAEGVDNAAEAGANAGSNWLLKAYSDAGALLSTPISVARATGVATFAAPLTVPNGVAVTDAASFGQVSAMNTGRNKLLNGQLFVDQAGVGPVGLNGAYVLDGWQIGHSSPGSILAQKTTSPFADFVTALGLTCVSPIVPAGNAFWLLSQAIEAINCEDLNFGLASAKNLTLQFWIQSSISGTFAAALRNAAADRSCVKTFTVVAGIPKFVTLTFPGDTTGTWNRTGTSVGVTFGLNFGIGATYATSTLNTWQAGNFVGATGQTNLFSTVAQNVIVAGLQLEPGSIASPFEHRLYSHEITLARRFYAIGRSRLDGYSLAGNNVIQTVPFSTFMRAIPSIGYSANSIANVSVFDFLPVDATSIWQRAAPTATGSFTWDGTWVADARF